MSIRVYEDIEQRSDEWFELRRGIITASTIKHFISVGAPDALGVLCPTCDAIPGNLCLSLARKEPTPIQKPHDARQAAASNEPSVIAPADTDTSRAMTLLLVAERITGWTDPSFISNDMLRGIEHESFARDAYSEHHTEAREVGFVTRDDWGFTIGYSPDGLVGDDGAIEIKSPRSKEQVRTFLADEVPAQHMPQLQTALAVSGRQWIDFVSFVGGMPLFVKRVLPDPRWQTAIVQAVRKFEDDAAQMLTDYRNATAGRPMTERVPDLELVIP